MHSAVAGADFNLHTYLFLFKFYFVAAAIMKIEHALQQCTKRHATVLSCDRMMFFFAVSSFRVWLIIVTSK